MSILKIGVVEDELVIARTIIGTLEELGYDHCGPAISYTEALEMLQEHKPDLLLLDIQLSGKKDGVDVAGKLNELYAIPFIFLTANSDAETIERAKKVRPHAYIVKPFTKDELYAAIEIAFSNFSANQSKSKTEESATWHNVDYIFVKDGYVFRKIYLQDILYLESDANYVNVHFNSQRKVLVRSTINEFTERLNPDRFRRVHRSYSVNIDKVEDVYPTEILMQGVKIPIGKSYKADLYRALGIKY